MAKYNNKVVISGGTIIDLTKDSVTADKLLTGYTAHDKSGAPVSGSMADNGAIDATITTPTQSVTVPAGYTKGGTVKLDSTSAANITSANIKKGVTILGVEGSAVGEISITYEDNDAGGQTAIIGG